MVEDWEMLNDEQGMWDIVEPDKSPDHPLSLWETVDFELKLCVYFTFLHLVSYLTINQQFGREAVKSHSDQRQVIFENGQVF
jgi:hypothetical protein